jgi:hypothetical protein
MYSVDARQAAASHPDEWSLTPWDPQSADEARKRAHERRVAAAKAAGQPEPPPPVEPELDDEDRAAFEQWKADREKAREVLDAAAKEQAEKDAKAAQVAEAQAIVESPPPQPDPTRRRPLQGAAKANADRSAERKAAEKAAADKAEADRLAGNVGRPTVTR